LICLGVWKTLPSWLTPSTTGQLTASGKVPEVAGVHPVSFELLMVDAAGQQTSLGEYSGEVKVVDLPAIGVTINATNGTLKDKDGNLVYTIDSKGRVGTYTINSAPSPMFAPRS